MGFENQTLKGSRVSAFGDSMNKITLRTLAALTIALAGCVVTSVYPFYTDTDLVFDPALVGQWVGVEKDGTTKDKLEFKKNGDKEYVVALEENHFLEDKYAAHLFKLKEQLFLDFCPLERHDPDFIPVHQIMKITVTGTRMKTIGIKYDWLTQLLTQNPHALRHVVTKNPKDATQTELVRRHLHDIRGQFQRGDFSGPSHIHGAGMPGLGELRAAKPREILITYRDAEGGAELTYWTHSPHLVVALHKWFDAQVSDHASDAMDGHGHDHMNHSAPQD